ncbi:restriction endonuclease subunit S [Weissella cibaria]|uniref:restriction endonuclease subunit S n=1 Tax=Weissella cibaria TaxID=137591 RepID=UPI00143F5FDD|nr:restriction endonuclease subunit S [Weissella cibaria]NKN30224.1 restriction endonuclease subunit S [Weissella cibaria]NKN79116.1 restriction endonuclease subunit S [Weissella cibaria]NKN97043.1 restriction endonuclease subunit S [Weissella cibaria]NKN99399.1 restriction endonuclease subunit S [Weissella cibaria]
MKFNLSELVKIVNGYAFKSADIISDQSAYVIKIKNIQSSKILLEKDSMTAEMDGLNKYQIKFNDILISLTGSGMNQMSSAVGKVGRFRHTQKAYLNQRVAKISSLDEAKLTNDYLYYFINRPEIQKDLVSVATGSANQVNISPKIIGELSIDLPDLAEQERITNILTAFDSKIEILESINDNLLELGITYTEELLVEHEYPVSTIKSMNLTVSDHVANGSFKALKDNVEIVENSGYALFLRNTDLKADLNGDRRFVTENSYEFLKKSRLFGGEVIISNVGDVGSVYHVPYLDVPMVAGNNVVFLQSEESWLTDYLYFYFKSRIGQHDIDSITSGSAQQKFNKTDFRALEIPVIPEHDVTILTKLIDNLNSNTREIRTLMDTRDALLKKLLN